MDAKSDLIAAQAWRMRDRLKAFSAWPQNTVAFLMLCVATAGAPFVFGSDEPATVALWVLWLGVAATTVSPKALRTPHIIILSGIALISILCVFIVHEQGSNTPWFATSHKIWAQASAVLKTELQPQPSIARNAPFYAIGSIAANILALVLGLMTGACRLNARRLLLVIGISGALYAAYGIFADMVMPTSLLWREKEAYIGSVTGPFVSRNTAATYFGSIAAIWFLVLLEAIRDRLPRGSFTWRHISEKVIVTANPGIAIPFLLFFLCLAALFMTQSRGGVIMSAIAIIVAFWLFFHRDLAGRVNRVMLIATAVLASLLVLQVLTSAVGNRLDTQGLADAGRFATYRATWKLIADHPWFGTGLGTFVWAFPAFRSDQASMWGIWDMAHSTPLQMAAETGIPLTVLTGLAWIVALVLLTRAAFVRRRDTIFPLAALAVSIIALGHSMIDFSLQITGYSIVVFAVLGIGLAQSFRSPRSSVHEREQWGGSSLPSELKLPTR